MTHTGTTDRTTTNKTPRRGRLRTATSETAPAPAPRAADSIDLLIRPLVRHLVTALVPELVPHLAGEMARLQPTAPERYLNEAAACFIYGVPKGADEKTRKLYANRWRAIRGIHPWIDELSTGERNLRAWTHEALQTIAARLGGVGAARKARKAAPAPSPSTAPADPRQTTLPVEGVTP